MGLKNRVRRLVERATGVRIFRNPLRGLDLAQDIARHLPAYRARVIFDVGANVGQSAAEFVADHPGVRVWCFEPVAATFRTLEAAVAKLPGVTCHRLAFGAGDGAGRMATEGASVLSRLVGPEGGASADAAVEDVTVRTLDSFLAEHGIEAVSLLKVDTEGADLDVLKGATAALAAQRIDFVEVEAGMHPGNTRHVPFEALKSFLEERQYFLFGLYEQMHEWAIGRVHLRRTNPVFISSRMIDQHRM